MPQPNKRKATLKNTNWNKKGKFGTGFDDTEVVMLGEQLKMELDDTFSEKYWENNKVNDWKNDIDLEEE
ncbi:12642_t:CDS:2 [Funneliformis mosseae]|uniref:12642_t:CDS:1 n=1 Tax=Funneliformis mosseae TaxID=27381 RepID=A0A9N9DFF4_FUNMO|nr:12642_t:CDS:2 [Funneliformis mosseae]